MSRESYKELLCEAFARYNTWAKLSADDRAALVRRIERACFNAAVAQCGEMGVIATWAEYKFVTRYSAQCYRIIMNLDTNIGGEFAERLIGGTIDANNVAEMSSSEINPSANKSEREEIATRSEQRVEQKVSKVHTCRKCGGRETTTKVYQGRAADEDVNISIKCINCGMIWRK